MYSTLFLCTLTVYFCVYVGPAAVEARNVFYYITYPGSVNWQAITDHNQLKV